MYNSYDRQVLFNPLCFAVMGPMHPPGPMRMMGPPPGGILGVAPPGFNPMMGPGGQRFPGV